MSVQQCRIFAQVKQEVVKEREKNGDSAAYKFLTIVNHSMSKICFVLHHIVAWRGMLGGDEVEAVDGINDFY